MAKYGKLGKIIATRRKSLNLTQEELAKKAKVTQGYLSNLEKERSPFVVSVKTLGIVSALELEPGTIWSEDSLKKYEKLAPNSVSSQMPIATNFEKVCQLVKVLDRDEKKAILKILIDQL